MTPVRKHDPFMVFLWCLAAVLTVAAGYAGAYLGDCAAAVSTSTYSPEPTALCNVSVDRIDAKVHGRYPCAKVPALLRSLKDSQ
jgi:hypothetical protein